MVLSLIKKQSGISLALLAIIVIAVVVQIGKKPNSLALHSRGLLETFDTDETVFVEKNNADLYDDYYIDIYSVVYNKPTRYLYEIENLHKQMNLTKRSRVLDVGSGLGFHLNLLKGYQIPAMGLERSKDMIIKSKEFFPKIIVKHGDAMDNLTFEPSSFTHIMCLFFTFYYLPDQEGFLRICNNWLEHNGYLALHLVDREKFNPIVPIDEITVKNPNHVNVKQVNAESLIRFNGFDYKSAFIKDYTNNSANLVETITKANGNIRKNRHQFNINTISHYEKLFKLCGFAVNSVIKLEDVGYYDQYIYVLKKNK